MDRDERARLEGVIAQAERLAPVAAGVRAHREEVRQAADAAGSQLRARMTRLRPAGTRGWRVLALGDGDDVLLGRLAADAALPGLSEGEQEVLDDLADRVPAVVAEARRIVGLRRLVTFGTRRAQADAQAGWLLRHQRGWGEDPEGWLSALDAQTREPALPLALGSALHPHVGLVDRLGGPTDHQEVVRLGHQPGGRPDRQGAVGLGHLAGRPDRVSAVGSGPLAGRPDQQGAVSLGHPAGRPGEPSAVVLADLHDLPVVLPPLASVITRADEARQQALTAGEAVRAVAADRLLAQMPVERLREATGERLRIGALTEAGITTVQQVLERGADLDAVPNVGPVTARRMRGAAQTLHTLALDDAPVRLDPDDRTPQATRLLGRLHTWDLLRQTAKATDLVALAQTLLPLADHLTDRTTHLAVLGDAPAQDLLDLVLPVLERAQELHDTLEQGRAEDPWADFVDRPAHYLALLSELGLVEETGTHGDLPEDVVEAVRAQELDTAYLEVPLRGYQSFAARFALVQEKVVIGDEMGLGKTVEALAALAHRATEGGRWFLVVCPAAVLSSWVREVDAKTSLEPRRLHGPDRQAELARWRADGGVALTTYSTLGSLAEDLDGFELDALVVDEAHYVKNPAAQRSRRVAALVARTQHVLLLTGTPLENRVGELATLVGYLRPDLLDGLGDSPVDFRRRIVPVYLRRNTEDVLVELPELVEVEEWLGLSAADEAAYRDAVASGSFMAMRRAAFASGTRSAKLAHLLEVVAEAEENGRRVIVFSYFRDVLDRVAASLPGPVFGPLTGSVPPARRQEVVDDFSRAAGGAALVAQIQAVGVGLNIQAASVVVLCEPQLKPTTEWQAIARARRMGQLQTVQVHRLLTEDSVDERLVELLSAKAGTFDRYARVSETARSAPEAYDLSEADLARRVVAAERARLFPGEDGTTLFPGEDGTAMMG
ncbi:DEAD/DEAH box helicase [Serinicoccus chungangensis]|uniref:DEAD/DEAH box helicase n=1 Tax=Serinicoccus chungangensis TaxID=767452 RepID=UPI001118EDFA|nr:DEAD/DEAH box helicase [Serinicoccus chungangensis]